MRIGVDLGTSVTKAAAVAGGAPALPRPPTHVVPPMAEHVTRYADGYADYLQRMAIARRFGWRVRDSAANAAGPVGAADPVGAATTAMPGDSPFTSDRCATTHRPVTALAKE